MWLPYSRVFREETCLDLSSLSTAWVRSPAAPACGRLPTQKGGTWEEKLEGREAGLPGGHRRGLAGAGQGPGERHSQHLIREVTPVPCGFHFYVCVPLISLLDSMCSFTRSLIFQQPISTVVNILELHTASASNKTRIFHMAKQAPASGTFAGSCPHSLCPWPLMPLSSSVMLRTLLSPSICTGCPSAGTTPPSSVYQLLLPLRAGASRWSSSSAPHPQHIAISLGHHPEATASVLSVKGSITTSGTHHLALGDSHFLPEWVARPSLYFHHVTLAHIPIETSLETSLQRKSRVPTKRFLSVRTARKAASG